MPDTKCNAPRQLERGAEAVVRVAGERALEHLVEPVRAVHCKRQRFGFGFGFGTTLPPAGLPRPRPVRRRGENERRMKWS
jgi:hypothetical protein